MSELTATHRLPIRRGMDVYSADQSEYIGSIVEVTYKAAMNASGARSTRQPLSATGRGVASMVGSPLPRREEGDGVRSSSPPPAPVGGAAAEGRSGESLGPFPTAEAGNSGPGQQSASNNYATEIGAPPADIGFLLVRPGRVAFFRGLLHVPIDAVRSMSLERVVLDRQLDQIPLSWRARPK